jgi:ATP-dependent Clp protease ATP-binding subunit ClpC
VPSPRLHQILGAASEIARSMGHSYLGVEHLFLAVLRDPHAVPTQALAEAADTGEAERHLLAIMSSAGYRTPSTAVQRSSGPDDDGGAGGPQGAPRTHPSP